MMINWNLLGIEPTRDTAEIKKAYRSMLLHTNPEDKPEEFMALRQAYEDALAWARTPEEEDAEEDEPSALERNLLPPGHPAYGWTRALQNLYLDFSRRIQPACWKELSEDPVCSRIDTVRDVEDALLQFLMEWWFVPDGAIRALDTVFRFEKNQERLKSKYPSDFVYAILLAPLHRSPASMEYEYFHGAPDADYDGWINSYYILTGHVNRGEIDEAWETVSAMEEMDIFHPYLNVEKAKLYLSRAQISLAAAEMEAVWPAYGCSHNICCMAGEVSLAEEAFSEAENRFRKALEICPDSRWGLLGMAEASLSMKDYDEAENRINQVLAIDPYSPRGKLLEEQLQESLGEVLMERLAEEGLPEQDKLRLAVILIDKGENQAAADLMGSFRSDDRKSEARRCHYLATALMELDQYEASLEAFHQARRHLQALIPITADEEERTKLGINLCQTSVMESIALENLDQMEEALTLITNISIDYPDQNMAFCRKAELHYEMKQYEEAVDAATESLRLDETFHLPYRIRANAFYELGHYNDAFRDCESCIDIYTGDIEAYFCKINILIEVGEFDEAFRELDDLESQVQGTQITFLRGKALEASDKMEEARLTYRRVLEDDARKDREIYPPAEVHSTAPVIYRLVQVCQELYLRSGSSAFRLEYMDLLREGVRKYPSNLDLLGDLAGEYYGMSHHREARKLYERITELDPSGLHYAQTAGNEIQMDHFDAALRHLQTAESLDPSLVYTQILFGAVYMHRGQFRMALQHLDYALQLADAQGENWPRILRDKAMIYSRMDQFDAAIQAFRENWERYQEPDDICSIMEIYRISGRYAESLTEGKQYLSGHSIESCPDILDEMKMAASSLGNWELTEHCCSRDPRPFFRNFYAGRHLMFSNEFGEDTVRQALKYFLQAYEADPSAFHNLLEVSRLYLKLKEKEKAYEFASKALETVPANFMESGFQRAYYLARSAEALAILGKYEEAEERIRMAMEGRKCEFCRHSGCLDAYCAMVYVCCLRGDAEGAAKYQQEGMTICPHDVDLLYLPEYFMTKRGFFK